MKSTFVRITNLLFLILLLCSNNNFQHKKIKMAIIKKIDFDIMSIIRIKCEKFEKYFNEEKKTIEIKNTNKLKELETIINKIAKDTANKNIDVRAKMIIFYSDKSTDTICTDGVRFCLNGQLMLENKALISYIKNSKP